MKVSDVIRPLGRPRHWLPLLLCSSLLLGGCGISSRLGQKMDGTVGDILFTQDEKVTFTLDADQALNPDADNESLSVVLRIYQLDAREAFASASTDALWEHADKVLGNALLDTREVVMVPGGHLVDEAPLKAQTRFVAVAAYFRQTPDARWRVLFDADAMRKDGLFTSPDGVELTLVEQHIAVAPDSEPLLASASQSVGDDEPDETEPDEIEPEETELEETE